MLLLLCVCVCVCVFLIFLPESWSQSDSLYNLIAVSWKRRNKNTPNLEYLQTMRSTDHVAPFISRWSAVIGAF